MEEKVNKYINAIIKAKWWENNIHWIPTDIIWWSDFWIKLAKWLDPLVTKKEICFFDENIKNNTDYHYLDFENMFEKTELMIFTIQLDNKYFINLSNLNPNVLIVLDSTFIETINILKSNWFNNNLLLID